MGNSGVLGGPIPWNDLNQASKFNVNSSQNLIAQLLGGDAACGGSPGLLVLALIGGGFALLIMLVMGGFQLLTNPTNPQGQESGRNRITWAIVGFFLLFSSFWIAQIIQTVFDINIVGTGSDVSGCAADEEPTATTPPASDPPTSLSPLEQYMALSPGECIGVVCKKFGVAAACNCNGNNTQTTCTTSDSSLSCCGGVAQNGICNSTIPF